MEKRDDLAEHTSGVRLRKEQLARIERMKERDSEIDLSTAVREGLDLWFMVKEQAMAAKQQVLQSISISPARARESNRNAEQQDKTRKTARLAEKRKRTQATAAH
jgi:hypothetical protein